MKTSIFKFFIRTLLLANAVSAAYAQESVEKQLDDCVKKEQVMGAVKGAAMGALAGFTAAMFSGKSDNAAKGALLGAAAGGAGGWLVAYNTAIDTCQKANPEWIPESKIERTKNMVQVQNETKYNKKQGIVANVLKVNAASTVKAGDKAEIKSVFTVLTPDGAETPIAIERKLFSLVDGKESEIKLLGNPSEQKTVEPGEHTDTVSPQIPTNARTGEKFRFEFKVSAGGKPATKSSAEFTVQ